MLTAREVIEELVEALYGLKQFDCAAYKIGVRWLEQYDKRQSTALPAGIPKKSCYVCGGEIFFARGRIIGHESKRWIPMVPTGLIDDHIILDAVQLVFSGGEGIVAGTGPGLQWLPHRVLCDLKAPPTDPVLAKLWHDTVGKAQLEEKEALADLLTVLQETQ